MLRKAGLCVFAAMLLAGCGDRLANMQVYGGAPYSVALKNKIEGAAQVFSYTHALGLLLPHDAVKQGFEKARNACLSDTTLSCTLISATANSGIESDSAMLSVALPHNQIARFEKRLTDSGAIVQSRSTTAENVTVEAGENGHKLAQLRAYRDRLVALSQRNALSVSDIMKVEAELSKVEADLAATEAEQRGIAERVAKELLTVSFGEREAALAPITRAFANAGASLADSTASVINFLIHLVPWLPIIAAAIFLGQWLYRFLRKKKPA